MNIFEVTRSYFKENHTPLLAETALTSTNQWAKNEAHEIAENKKVYLAEHQSSGQGRNQNSWISPPPGDGLLVSFSWALQSPPQAITAPLFGLALFKAVKEVFNGPFSLKAPNDLYLGRQKLAGLLVETTQMGTNYRLIVGLGLNVFSAPDGLVPSAAHLSSANPDEIIVNSWDVFLSTLEHYFQLASQECLATHLSPNQRKELLDALNLKPDLIDPIESVSPFGDLFIAGKSVSWRDL